MWSTYIQGMSVSKKHKYIHRGSGDHVAQCSAALGNQRLEFHFGNGRLGSCKCRDEIQAVDCTINCLDAILQSCSAAPHCRITIHVENNTRFYTEIAAPCTSSKKQAGIKHMIGRHKQGSRFSHKSMNLRNKGKPPETTAPFLRQ